MVEKMNDHKGFAESISVNNTFNAFETKNYVL